MTFFTKAVLLWHNKMMITATNVTNVHQEKINPK